MTLFQTPAAGPDQARRLYVFSGGFLTQRRLRRILHLSGYRVSLGRPGAGDLIGIWGNSPTAHRGIGIAARTDAKLVRVEDAFLRSVLPGRSGSAPLKRRAFNLTHIRLHGSSSSIRLV